jgi:hypothetical protein
MKKFEVYPMRGDFFSFDKKTKGSYHMAVEIFIKKNRNYSPLKKN